MHTDPYLAALIASNPKYEQEIYELFLAKNLDAAITDFANTPTWVLARLYEKYVEKNQGSYMYSSILRHDNFDLGLIDQFLKEGKTEFYSWIVHNSNIGAKRLLAIANGGDAIAAAWANYYLYKDTPEIEEFLLTELKKKKVEDVSFIANHILRTCKLPESCVDTLMKKYLEKTIDKYSKDQTVGVILAQNPFLTDEQRAALHLMGYRLPTVTIPEPPFLPTSQLFPLANYKLNVGTDKSLLKAIAATGHPVSAIDEDFKETKIEINELNAYQLIKAEYLHRALWTELIGVDGFQLDYRNGYRVMDLFISHKTLGAEFEDSEYDDGWAVGGVLAGYEDRTWVATEETIDPDRAAELLTNFGDSWDEVIYNYESLSELYAPALAHFYAGDTETEYTEKYGVKLTKDALEVIVESACENADQEEFDVEPYLNSAHKENLSWKKLSTSKKEQIVALLTCGLGSANGDLKGDAEHLLGCIALHPATPKGIIKELEELGNELVTATLARR
jgi:hypothetical protein